MNTFADAPIVALLIGAILGNAWAAALSAGEAAVLRVTRSAAAELVDDQPELAPRLTRLLDNRTGTVAAAAFLRVIVEVLASTFLTVALAASLDSWIAVVAAAAVISVVFALAIVRISPRALGRRRPESVLRRTSWALIFAVRTVGPLAIRLSARPTDVEAEERELRDMMERVGDSAAIEDDELAMLRSVFELSDTVTREVMVPRTDMVCVTAGTSVEKALDLFVRSGFSRVPVIGETTDDLRGMLYFKDTARVLLTSAHRGDDGTGSRIVDEVMREPLFVPESKPVDDLLREFQSSASHVAVVVDEYGGIAGLVTVEDALEEIVGELTDEHDVAPREVEDLGDGSFRVPARLPLDELGELFGVELDDDDVDTAGGLLAKARGHVPIPGAVAHVEGLRLEAERFEGRRRLLATIVASKEVPLPAGEADDENTAASGAGDERTAGDDGGSAAEEEGLR